MNWQNYVDDYLIGSGDVLKALICCAETGSVLASNGLKGEGTGQLVCLFKIPADAITNGITFDGVKYTAIKADPRSIYGQKDATGIVCAKSNTSIIVGYYDEKGSPGRASSICEKLADHLIEENL